MKILLRSILIRMCIDYSTVKICEVNGGLATWAIYSVYRMIIVKQALYHYA